MKYLILLTLISMSISAMEVKLPSESDFRKTAKNIIKQAKASRHDCKIMACIEALKAMKQDPKLPAVNEKGQQLSLLDTVKQSWHAFQQKDEANNELKRRAATAASSSTSDEVSKAASITPAEVTSLAQLASTLLSDIMSLFASNKTNEASSQQKQKVIWSTVIAGLGAATTLAGILGGYYGGVSGVNSVNCTMGS